MPALHVAVKKGNVDIIKILLENKKLDSNAKDSFGKLPIEYTKDEQIIQLLNL